MCEFSLEDMKIVAMIRDIIIAKIRGFIRRGNKHSLQFEPLKVTVTVTSPPHTHFLSKSKQPIQV